MAASTSAIPLSPAVVSAFKPSKVFTTHNTAPFSSLSFDDKGEFLITAAEDETMQLYNCKTGKHQKQLYSKKYGVHLARFTHKSTAIIHASTKEDDGIRYLSLHDNNYLRYFKGHKKRVTSLEMSPQDDTFLSGATDDTVRLWDLRTQNACGLLNIAGHPSATYDPAGLVFAVALNLRSSVLFYDQRFYDQAPFISVAVVDIELSRNNSQPRIPMITSLKFSNDGKYLLLGTGGDYLYVLGAFSGALVVRLDCQTPFGLERDPTPPYNAPIEPAAGLSGGQVCWSPDGRYVISGSIDGKLHIWDVFPPNSNAPSGSLLPMKSIDGHQGGPSRIVGFNPKSALIVSGGNDLAFWLPEPESSAA